METVGQYLRKGRELRQVSIEDVVLHTRIQSLFIEAIEEDQFDRLPNLVSAKGFVRSYARFLRIDEVEAIRLFSSAYPGTPPPPPLPEAQTLPLFPPARNREILPDMTVRIGQKTGDDSFRLFLKVFSVGMLFIFLLMVLISWWSKRGEEPSTTTENPVEGHPAPGGVIAPQSEPALSIAEPSPMGSASSTAVSDPALSGAVTGTSISALPFVSPVENAMSGKPTSLPVRPVSARPDGVTAGTSPPAGIGSLTGTGISVTSHPPSESSVLHETEKPIVLMVEAIEPTWIRLTIDEKETRNVLLQEGQKGFWKAKKSFLFTTGNAGGARVFLDGKALGFLGKKNRVVKNRLFTRD
jgi:cytoskeletal protein RodZ